MTATATKERGIIFKPEMVRATLEDRKSNTRRLVKPQPVGFEPETAGYGLWTWWHVENDRNEWEDRRCPYGVPGERLYVKEAARQLGLERTAKNGQYYWPKFDDEGKARRWFDSNCYYVADRRREFLNEPQGALNAMFMPRWASRITLELTDVRVERLQEISKSDALAEGVDLATDPFPGTNAPDKALARFPRLWDSIAKPGAKWADDPWVWVLAFRRLTP